nr:TM2 domain-containing protein [uncultured Rhodoferax sp.]
MKNKTVAVWLTLALGSLGLHRLYLGRYNWLSKLSPVPTLLGLYGVFRARNFGVDDPLSWLLIPLLGFMLATFALLALIYGLMSPEQWNARYNPGQPDNRQGGTNWLTVGGLVVAMGLGSTILMATLAFSIQRTFEYQMQKDKAPTTSSLVRKSAG